jgi:hypothetical protein
VCRAPLRANGPAQPAPSRFQLLPPTLFVRSFSTNDTLTLHSGGFHEMYFIF